MLCAIEITKVALSSCSPVLRPRSYQSIIIHCFSLRLTASKLPKRSLLRVSFPSRALDVDKESLFTVYPPDCALEVTKVPCALEVTKVLLVIVFLPTCALEDTRVSQFVCFPPVLCPRSCQSFAVSRFHRPNGALEFTSVALLVFPSCLAPAKLPKLYFLGKHFKIYISQTLDVFGNNSRNKLAH